MIDLAIILWLILLGVATLLRDRAVQGELDELRARLWALEQDVDR